LTNILNQLVANGVLTRGVSSTIVDKLNKLDNGVLTKILNFVSKKPEAIALIQTLSKYPNVVDAIKSGDITGLNTSELKIFDSLNVLDNNTLKVLVDYYITINVKSDDVFDTSWRAESQLIDEDETKLDDSVVSDSGINPQSDISTISKPPPINYSYSSVYQEQAAKIYEAIKSPANRNAKANINNYLNAYYPINDNNDSITESGKQLVISYIINNNIKIDKRANP